MKNRLPLNAILFVVLFLVIGLASYFLKVNEVNSSGRPWHMQMNDRGDSLSNEYLDQYRLMDHGRAIAQLDSFGSTTVLILVDAWGVPYDERKLADEFAVFDSLPHQNFLHRRLMSYTRFAEQAEFRNKEKGSVYLFNGDSLEYRRYQYVPELGFEKRIFLEKCNDECALRTIDSLLEKAEFSKFIAFSLQCSREGDAVALKKSLNNIAEFAKIHSKVRFVVQGTHRPILVSREEREKYYAYWVPVVVVNSRQ